MEKIKIGVVNGPNINLLGLREPLHYGNEKWIDIEGKIIELANQKNVELYFFQSNHEGEIIDFIQSHINDLDGIIINPASLTLTGYGIIDAINAISTPFVEVHLSNIYKRGGWHAKSIFSEYAIGVISGFKGYGYEMALSALIQYININYKNSKEEK
ncbi:MAG: type II 3-dehydroquinate dehydratase [Clostridiaceae bacterium]